jgi:hypothetical protein
VRLRRRVAGHQGEDPRPRAQPGRKHTNPSPPSRWSCPSTLATCA